MYESITKKGADAPRCGPVLTYVIRPVYLFLMNSGSWQQQRQQQLLLIRLTMPYGGLELLRVLLPDLRLHEEPVDAGVASASADGWWTMALNKTRLQTNGFLSFDTSYSSPSHLFSSILPSIFRPFPCIRSLRMLVCLFCCPSVCGPSVPRSM